ncbi:DsrE family protein [Arthrobacter sp. LAPM80]|uniref:DsrE family protein n=1 Tax=Arthrobacter sp. LAPM80 TaxID=3141788 RepID=UPI00398A762D
MTDISTSSSPTGEVVPAGRAGLVFHGTGPDPGTWLPNVLRAASNAAEDLGAGTDIHVVIQGPGVALLVPGYAAADRLEALLRRGVKVLACGNSLRSVGLEATDLTAGVGTVPAAVGYLARLQWAGWAYIRL